MHDIAINGASVSFHGRHTHVTRWVGGLGLAKTSAAIGVRRRILSNRVEGYIAARWGSWVGWGRGRVNVMLQIGQIRAAARVLSRIQFQGV